MDPKFFLCVFVLENRIWMFRVTLPNRLVAPISGCWWNTSLGAKVLVDEILTAPVGHSERRTWRAHNYCACIRLSTLIRISSAHTMFYDAFSRLGFHHFYLTIFVVVLPTIPCISCIKWVNPCAFSAAELNFFFLPARLWLWPNGSWGRFCRRKTLSWAQPGVSPDLVHKVDPGKKNGVKWGPL